MGSDAPEEVAVSKSITSAGGGTGREVRVGDMRVLFCGGGGNWKERGITNAGSV